MARILCLVAAFVLATAAAAQAPLEAGVRAAYIYRFLEYVTWPAAAFRAPEDPILIGTVQSDAVSAELQRILSERMAQGRKLVLVQVKEERDLPVHVLYVPKIDTPRLAKLVEAARQQPTLVVTDDPEGAEKGAAITFVPSGGRIQFEVALDAAARSGITISSRLLAVAVRVKKGEYRSPVHAAADAVR